MGIAPVELHRHRLRRSTIVACSMMLNASQGLPAPEQRSRQVLAMAFARGMTIDPPESWSQSHAGIVRIQTKPHPSVYLKAHPHYRPRLLPS